jgi:uncharacterized repeat protein (TIGR02543 family)
MTHQQFEDFQASDVKLTGMPSNWGMEEASTNDVYPYAITLLMRSEYHPDKLEDQGQKFFVYRVEFTDDQPSPATHTVSFDTAGGSTVESQDVADGSQAVKPDAPTLEGHSFKGWLLDGQPYDFSQPVTGDLKLTASWAKDGQPAPVTHTVAFDPAGGSTVESQTIADGGLVSEPADPTYGGRVFDGWHTQDGQPYDFASPVTGDMTLFAAWKDTPGTPDTETFTVTFDTTGGSAIDAQDVAEGSRAVKPEDPTFDGHVFKGWLLDGEPYDFSQPVTGDLKLTAKWDKADGAPNPSDDAEPSLASTGVAVGGAAMGVLVLVAAGAAIIMVRRRRDRRIGGRMA